MCSRSSNYLIITVLLITTISLATAESDCKSLCKNNGMPESYFGACQNHYKNEIELSQCCCYSLNTNINYSMTEQSIHQTNTTFTQNPDSSFDSDVIKIGSYISKESPYFGFAVIVIFVILIFYLIWFYDVPKSLKRRMNSYKYGNNRRFKEE